jgi:hypothetical protein
MVAVLAKMDGDGVVVVVTYGTDFKVWGSVQQAVVMI